LSEHGDPNSSPERWCTNAYNYVGPNPHWQNCNNGDGPVAPATIPGPNVIRAKRRPREGFMHHRTPAIVDVSGRWRLGVRQEHLQARARPLSPLHEAVGESLHEA
jgi:hypothetical protein